MIAPDTNKKLRDEASLASRPTSRITSNAMESMSEVGQTIGANNRTTLTEKLEGMDSHLYFHETDTERNRTVVGISVHTAAKLRGCLTLLHNNQDTAQRVMSNVNSPENKMIRERWFADTSIGFSNPSPDVASSTFLGEEKEQVHNMYQPTVRDRGHSLDPQDFEGIS
jgi:hypothetical protein